MPLFDSSLGSLRWSLGAQGSKLGALAGKLLKSSAAAAHRDNSMQGFPPPSGSALRMVQNSSSVDTDSISTASGDAKIKARLTLIETIERQVLPALMQTHGLASCDTAAIDQALQQPSDRPTPALALQEFISAAMAGDQAACAAVVSRLMDAKFPLGTIYLDLLAPAAREIGERWDDDTASFTEVTVGVGQLQQLILNLSPRFLVEGHRAVQPQTKRALLSVCPGGVHTLGLTLVAEFMRAAGWQVQHLQQTTTEQLLAQVKSHAYDIVGLSAGASVQMHEMRELIAALRDNSAEAGMLVLVGGPVFVANPHWAIELGADGSAPDASQTVMLADQLLRAKRPTLLKQQEQK
jgi:MerR family transcriptional regulator, light-induced transcriptional regulator